MKKVICLGGGNNQISVINSALRQNLEVIVIDQNRESKGAKLSKYFINESTHSSENIIRKLNEERISKDIIGILNRSSGYPVVTNSILNNFLDIESYSKEVAEACISKIKVNNILNKKNILVPKSVFFNQKGKEENLKFPFILKPEITPGGKVGVFYIDSKEKLNSYFDKFHKIKIVKEEFISGRDFCLGAIIFEKELLPLTLLEEVHDINKFGKIFSKGIISIPPELDYELLDKITNQSILITKILDINKSFVWISFKYTTKKEIFFIEIHLDMGGDFVLDYLLPKATGKDNIIDEFLKIYLFGKKYYKGMLDLKLTSMKFDKGEIMTHDKRRLLLKQNLNYENIKDELFR